jgi:predicted methyltransferase
MAATLRLRVAVRQAGVPFVFREQPWAKGIRMNRYLVIVALTLALAGCSRQAPAPAEPEPESAAVAEPTSGERLDAVLAAQPDAEKSRYAFRHPRETLQFFGVEPGMTVVDTLPGDVWYSGILLDYLGAGGRVIGASYSTEMWKYFGEYSPDPVEIASWRGDFVAKMEARRGADDAAVAAIHYGAIPDDLAGKVDVVIMSRALHHFTRLEGEHGYLTQALADIDRMLKPGGIVGVEAHRAPEGSPDAWAAGEAGYVKQSAVIAAFQKAGFELVAASEINANPKDQPTEKDMVWRLPPTLATSENDATLKAAMQEIGESDRMTLKFRKPG